MYGLKLYFYSGLVCSGLLIPLYLVILFKARAGTKYKFVTRIVWLLIASNLAEISFLISLYYGGF